MTPATVRFAHRRDLFLLLVLCLGQIAIVAVIQNSYYLSLLTYASIYSIAALGLFLLFGYAGQISLAQAAFFGMGAYIQASFTMKLGLPAPLAMIAAAIVPGIVGWLVSHQLLKLTTNYLAMATLAFGTICFILFAQMRGITGGLDPGVIGVPPFTFLGISLRTPSAIFLLSSVVLVLTLLITINLIHSRIGRGLRALRSSEVAAAGLGVDVIGFKVAVFAIAAAMSGVAGSLFALVQTTFNASSFSVSLSIEILLMVVIGSVFTPWGALFGALFVTLVPSLLEGFDHFKMIVYGILMTIVMIFMPDGLGKAIIDAASSLVVRIRRS